jgi:YVTN family beta-propeller protein
MRGEVLTGKPRAASLEAGMADRAARPPDRWARPIHIAGVIAAAAVIAALTVVQVVGDHAGGGDTRSIGVGTFPAALAVTPDGRTLYVANHGDNTVTPVDVATGTPGTPIPVGQDPDALAVTPDGSTLFVANDGSGTVTPVDVAAGTAGPPFSAGSGPEALAVTPDGRTLYAADGFLADEVTPIDVATGVAGTPVPLAPLDPVGLVISPNGQTVYAGSKGDSSSVPGDFAVNSVTPITVATGDASLSIPLAGGAQGLAVTPNGRTLYATDPNIDNTGDTVTPIDLASGRAGTPIIVGTDPVALAMAPDGRFLFVANSQSDTVTEITLRN